MTCIVSDTGFITWWNSRDAAVCAAVGAEFGDFPRAEGCPRREGPAVPPQPPSPLRSPAVPPQPPSPLRCNFWVASFWSENYLLNNGYSSSLAIFLWLVMDREKRVFFKTIYFDDMYSFTYGVYYMMKQSWCCCLRSCRRRVWRSSSGGGVSSGGGTCCPSPTSVTVT